MQYGFMSDAHGDLEALKAAFALLEGFDEIYFLGDIAGERESEECIRILRDNNIISLVGNHDRWVFETRGLSQESLAFLNSLPLYIEKEDFLVQHSAYEKKGNDLFFQYIQSTRECETAFEKYRHRIIFIGHNHVPGINQLQKGKISYIPIAGETKIELEPDSRYIVTVGTPKKCVVTYDSTVKKISYRFVNSAREDAGLGGEGKFLIDGKLLSEEECRRVFSDGSMDDRERRCVEMMEGRTVVDVGCYVGRCVSRIKHSHPEMNIMGVDYFHDHIRVAQLLNPDQKKVFFQMSVYDLALPGESIDCALMQEVIEHLEAPGAAIKEINRALKTGGALVLSTNNPYYWRDLARFARSETGNLAKRILGRKTSLGSVIFFENVEWNRHISCFTPATLMTLLQVNGFEYVEHSYGFAGNWLDRILGRLFPFLGTTQIIKVRKRESAPAKMV